VSSPGARCAAQPTASRSPAAAPRRRAGPPSPRAACPLAPPPATSRPPPWWRRCPLSAACRCPAHGSALATGPTAACSPSPSCAWCCLGLPRVAHYGAAVTAARGRKRHFLSCQAPIHSLTPDLRPTCRPTCWTGRSRMHGSPPLGRTDGDAREARIAIMPDETSPASRVLPQGRGCRQASQRSALVCGATVSSLTWEQRSAERSRTPAQDGARAAVSKGCPPARRTLVPTGSPPPEQ